MRKTTFLFLVVLVSLLIFSMTTLVFGLLQNEASTTLSWSKQIYSQGEDGIVTISFDNQSPEELKINKIQILFDWTTDQNSTFMDFSEDPVGIPSNDNHIFEPIFFNVPQNTTEGPHSVVIKLEGLQHGILWYDIEWTSIETQIEITTNYQQLFNQLNPGTLANLTQAQNANFTNTNAIELLDKAENEYNLATSYEHKEEYQDALSHLQQTQDYLNQAQEKEQTLTTTDDLTTTIGALIMLVVLGLIVSIVFGRKTKKQLNS